MPRAMSTSFYPGAALKAYLKALGARGPREGVSRLVERTVQRYSLMVAASLPAWSLDEWLVALKVLHDLDVWAPTSIEVLGLILQQGLEQRRGAGQSDPTNFAYRAKSLTASSRVAVAEVVDRYRRRHEQIEGEALKALLVDMGAPGIA